MQMHSSSANRSPEFIFWGAGVTTVPRALLPDLVKFFPAYIKSTSVNICTVGFSSSKIDAAKLATYPNDVDPDYDVRA